MNDITRTETVPGGLRLTMRDGSVWFHPNTGAAPILERRNPLLAAAIATGRLHIVKG